MILLSNNLSKSFNLITCPQYVLYNSSTVSSLILKSFIFHSCPPTSTRVRAQKKGVVTAMKLFKNLKNILKFYKNQICLINYEEHGF